MSRYVVDASVAIKWFLPEIHSEEALRLRISRDRLHVPALMTLELGNVRPKGFVEERSLGPKAMWF